MHDQERQNYQPTLEELLPNGISEAGFLESGQTLEEVLNRDSRALEIMGYSVQEVAELLAPVAELAAFGGNFAYIAPNGRHYEVKTQTWRGTQECPWHDMVDWRKSSGATDIYITGGEKEDKPVHIAGLIRHLIESHKFFEGGSYRVPPEKIIEMFGSERIPGSFEKVKQLSF